MKQLFNLKKVTLICFVSILFLSFNACHKEGTGGKSTVNGTVKHHDKLIPYTIVYIKYGNTDFPGSTISNYDASVTTDADAHYEFKNLRRGDYYLYGVGYDNTAFEQVTGGIHVKLKYNKSTKTDIPVTE